MWFSCDCGVDFLWLGAVGVEALLEHYLAVGVLPVDEAGPAVVDGGVGGGGYVYGDVVIFGSGDEAEEGEEKREKDGEEHCEVAGNEIGRLGNVRT